ncbi:MAG: prepilin-type N-terminal cleavage/methylation domain-containing protein [Planctomycetes bacterium]|nr:prepilin-type N-terminal cleavage/methylation domain-containing protein [Planctomycetota bacterium]
MRRSRPIPRRPRPTGFTLLELVVALAILLVLLGAAIQVTLQGQAGYETDTLALTLEGDGRRVIDQIAHEVRQAAASTLVPATPAASTSLSFKMNTGYGASGVQLGPLFAYAFALESGEFDNGLDDNRNGLTDEGVVTRQVAGGVPVTIARYVRKNGLTFTWNAATSTLQLALVLERLDSRGQLLSRTVKTSVKLRN